MYPFFFIYKNKIYEVFDRMGNRIFSDDPVLGATILSRRIMKEGREYESIYTVINRLRRNIDISRNISITYRDGYIIFTFFEPQKNGVLIPSEEYI